MEMRLGKGFTTYYNSLEELAEAWNCKPVVKRTKDLDKLKSQQEKFLGKCKACGQNLSFLHDTNILCCQNEACKGYKIVTKNEDGTENVRYAPVYRVLDEVGAEIGANLFDATV